MRKKSASQASKKSKVTPKLEVLNVKISRADRTPVDAKARKWAKGNLSAWLRHAGRMYVPKKGEAISPGYKVRK